MEQIGAGNKKRILLVEDDPTTRDALAKIIEKEGYCVATAVNGRIARDVIAVETYDLVISDIHMPGSPVTGIELLHFIKKVSSSRVILMTGFASLVETKEAAKLGADGFLAKPFKREDLIRAIHATCGPSDTEPPAADEEDSYCKINIDDFVSGKQVRYNIFVRLSKAKYVKIAHSGEDLAAAQIKAFKGKGIRHLYLRKEDFNSYLQFSLNLSRAACGSPVISGEKKLRLLKHTGEVMLEYLYTADIDEESFEEASTIVQSTVGFLAGAQESLDLVAVLSAHSDSLYAHSLGVSLYSCLIARAVGWTSANTIYKVSMAGLLHDIGMKEIDRSVCERPRSTLNTDEVKMLETHPSRGMDILSRTPCIPSDVLQIVLQHHERDSGNGYPAGLLKPRIHPLARLLAVADEFCDLSIKGPNYAGLAPSAVIDRMVAVYGSVLEPKFIGALLNIVKKSSKSPASL